MTGEEYQELMELRAYRREKEACRLERAFMRLEELSASKHDPIMSRRSFNYIVDALMALRDEIKRG